MINSRLPWTTRFVGADTQIIDADGNVIGTFSNPHDADLLIEWQTTVQEIDVKINWIEEAILKLKAEREQQFDELNKVYTTLSECVNKLDAKIQETESAIHDAGENIRDLL